MKLTISIILFFSFLILKAQDDKPTPKEVQQGTEQLGKQVKSMIDYFQKYEEKSSQNEKKKAYEKVVDEMDVKGEATEKEKDDAFKIMDAYIKADQAPSKPHKKRKQVALKDNPKIKKQAQDIFDKAKNRILAMSYEEYEQEIWKTNPMASRREIKESYNKLHKDDAKHVVITSSDDELTQTQKQINAFNQMENAKTYSDYKNAVKTLNPNLTDKEIRNAWENR